MCGVVIIIIMRIISLITLAAVCVFAQDGYEVPRSTDLWTYLGTFSMSEPAFVQVVTFDDDPTHEKHLLVSEFSGIPFVKGGVYLAGGIKESIETAQIDKISPLKIGGGFKWPNMINTVPTQVFGSRAVLVPDGFIVPTHQTGGLYIILLDQDNNPTATHKISKDKSSYFYHTGEWIDFNGDGKLDLLTARTDGKKGDGQLLWFENPGQALTSDQEWTEHLITEGPDVLFTIQELDNDPSTLEIFAGEFWNEQLTLNVVTVSGGELKQRVVIDNTIKHAYRAEVVDLNGDGKLEVVVNNHETSTSDTAVYAFEIPADEFLDASKYVRHTIASEFPVQWGFTNMAPGFTNAVWPYASDKAKPGKKADFLVAGDGDYRAHLLEYKGDWEYANEVIKNENGTVGIIAIDDIDEDGWNEFIVANYDKGYVEVYTFATEARIAAREMIAMEE